MNQTDAAIIRLENPKRIAQIDAEVAKIAEERRRLDERHNELLRQRGDLLFELRSLDA